MILPLFLVFTVLFVQAQTSLLVNFHGSDEVSVLGECQLEGQQLGDHFSCPGNSSAFVREDVTAPDGRKALHFHRDPHFRRAEVEAGEMSQWLPNQRYYIGYEFMITNNNSNLVIFQWYAPICSCFKPLDENETTLIRLKLADTERRKRADKSVAPKDNIPLHLEFLNGALKLQVTTPGTQKVTTIASIPVTTNEVHHIALAFDTFMNCEDCMVSQDNKVSFWFDGTQVDVSTDPKLSLWSTKTKTYPKFGIYRGEYDGPYNSNTHDPRYIFDNYVYRIQISNISLEEIQDSSGIQSERTITRTVQHQMLAESKTEPPTCSVTITTPPKCTDRGTVYGGSTCLGKLGSRSYYISFPNPYRPIHHRYPLILSFHGRTKDPAQQQQLTGFSENNDHSIVVYPRGSGHPTAWQGDPDCPSDDVSFVKDLLDHLISTYSIERSRIYATGKSGGGGLLNLLACDAYLSSKIAAFAAASGAFYVNGTGGSDESRTGPLVLPPCLPSDKTRAIPFMEFHGLSDCTIKYKGGFNKRGNERTRPVLDVVHQWANPANCTTNPIEVVGDCGIQKHSWTCNNVVDTVVHYAIPKMKHNWPHRGLNPDCCLPGVKDPDCHYAMCNTCIDGSSIMLDWLFRFSIGQEGDDLVADAFDQTKFEL